MWTFCFGTVGAGAAFAFAPSAFLFLHAIAEHGRATLSTAVGLAFTMAFMCQWPPLCIVAVFFVLAVLTSWRKWMSSRRQLAALLVPAAVVALLLLLTIISLAGAKDLVGYATDGAFSGKFDLRGDLGRFCRATANIAVKMHPLILVMGLGGLWILPSRSLRRWLAIAAVCLVIAYTFGHYFAPQMQLFRLSIALGLIAAIPAAIWAEHILSDQSAAMVPVQGIVLALLVVGVPNLGDIYHGRGSYPFKIMRGFLPVFAEWVHGNVPEDHRLLFAARSYHYYGKGHVAYLPILTGREMMSCDYYEFPWGTFDPEFPKQAFHGSKDELHSFLVRHGVSHVVARCDQEAEPYRGRDDLFREVPEFHAGSKWGRFRMFEVVDSPGIVQEGSAQVHSDFNRIDVDFSPGCERVVLAYNWNGRMTVSSPSEILPHETDSGETFIEVRSNGARHATVRYRPRF